MTREQSQIIVGLDIGTTKVGVIIGEIENGTLNVIGVGVSPSAGLRKGVVLNIDKTCESVRKAVEEAELMSGVDVQEVFVGIAGSHIQSKNSRGVIAISRKGGVITVDDVERVVEAARAIPLAQGREILHVVPRSYMVDDQSGIPDPVGMTGVRLEGEIHIVSGDVRHVQSLVRAVEGAGLRIAATVLEPLASSMAVLEEEEKELGVAMVDIGGGTTDLAVFYHSSICHTSSIPIAGDLVTSDIAIGLRTVKTRAEEIKKKHGCAMVAMVPPEDVFVLQGVGGFDQREISRQDLASIIEPRMTEIFYQVQAELHQLGLLERLSAGIVLTGGGSLLPGAAHLASQIIGLPVRLGAPQGFGGLVDSANSPKHATGVGLALYGLANGGGTALPAPGGDRIKDLVDRMKSWVVKYF